MIKAILMAISRELSYRLLKRRRCPECNKRGVLNRYEGLVYCSEYGCPYMEETD